MPNAFLVESALGWSERTSPSSIAATDRVEATLGLGALDDPIEVARVADAELVRMSELTENYDVAPFTQDTSLMAYFKYGLGDMIALVPNSEGGSSTLRVANLTGTETEDGVVTVVPTIIQANPGRLLLDPDVAITNAARKMINGTVEGQSLVAQPVLSRAPAPAQPRFLPEHACTCDSGPFHGVDHGSGYTFFGPGGWAYDQTPPLPDGDGSHGIMCGPNMEASTTMGPRLSEDDALFLDDQFGQAGPILNFWYLACRQFGTGRPFNARGYVVFMKLWEWVETIVPYPYQQLHWWYDLHLWKSTDNPPDYDYEIATTHDPSWSDPYAGPPAFTWLPQDTNPAEGDVLSLKVLGNDLVVKYNGAVVLTATDSDLPAGSTQEHYDESHMAYGEWASFELNGDVTNGGSCSAGNFTATTIC